MDAMEEFRVISNNYSAEYGHSTGGIINLSTRSGTNDFHGSVFEYARNDAFDARNFFAKERTPIRMHQFGSSLGGPIRKDKTHFFVSWERTRQLTSTTVLSTVPSLAQRGGDFSGLRNAAGKPILIYDPATTSGKNRQPFAGNLIPHEPIRSRWRGRRSTSCRCRTGRPRPRARTTTAQPKRRASIATSWWRRWITNCGRAIS